jgi:hypothetical protein
VNSTSCCVKLWLAASESLAPGIEGDFGEERRGGAAVISRLSDVSDYGSLVAEGFGEAMVSESARGHLTRR